MLDNEDEGDYVFLESAVRNLPGWLEDYAALMTMRILRWQEKNVPSGPLFEIGVYQGRYFSLLIRSGSKKGEIVIGLDTFQYVSEERVENLLATAGFEGGYSFLKMFSTDVTANDLLSTLGSKPRFISIDGSHEKEDVHWDLRLAEQLLSSHGIVSVDDFLNPVTLGVNDGVNAFFSQPRSLEPVLFTSNKLFLSRPGQARLFREVIEEIIVSDKRELISLNFQAMLKLERHHVQQKLWGKSLLVAY